MLQDTVRDPKNANEDVDVSVLNRDTVWTYDRGQQTVGSAPLGALLVHCEGGDELLYEGNTYFKRNLGTG